ncbi:MAG: DUF4386 domain-containing protein [Anaerolineales bacterium]|nr:DUF4386 family protein [Chloroflexi bacterium CFX1]MCK6539913.1 DUF4386 domain-containing protein [Anaerolineales bacterium]MCQ3952155.1 hypothetical protein [Chloroflexota bacterium]MDL1918830.1 DUF4386 family protein [Chloroflexi bacterium CFX5]NUQ57927.1 DUF4386 family protein [Anaerolineales bacterium]
MKFTQSTLQKAGGVAALVNAVLALVSLIVAFGWIGPAALMDKAVLARLALENPAPLIFQDLLKFASAVTASVLVIAMYHRLRRQAPRGMKTALFFGLFSIALLLANASLSLFAVSQASTFTLLPLGAGGQLGGTYRQFEITAYVLHGLLNELIGLLGMAAIFVNGFWYLPVNWAFLKTANLPRWLCILGLAMGGMSLLPPLGIVVLTLSIPWALGLGATLLRKEN